MLVPTPRLLCLFGFLLSTVTGVLFWERRAEILINVCNRDKWKGPFLPLGPTSNSARKPSSPAAMLVGIAREACLREGPGDFLGFFPDNQLIRVPGGREERKW